MARLLQRERVEGNAAEGRDAERAGSGRSARRIFSAERPARRASPGGLARFGRCLGFCGSVSM